MRTTIKNKIIQIRIPTEVIAVLFFRNLRNQVNAGQQVLSYSI